MVRNVLAVIAVSAAVSVVACGGGPPLPQTPSIAGGATGVACGPRDEHCAPLVVDQPQDVRTDLGVVISTGVAVYAGDGHAIRLLRDCHVDGSYRFIRLPRDVQSQQIKTADEV